MSPDPSGLSAEGSIPSADWIKELYGHNKIIVFWGEEDEKE